MKFVIDMNLAPAWCEALKEAGHEAVHWSEVGDPKATDAQALIAGAIVVVEPWRAPTTQLATATWF